MGLLDKAVGFAFKATESIVDTANKKIDAVKQKRAEEERRFIQNFPYKNRYTIKQKDTTSLDLVLWEVLERDSYIVYDANETPVYIAKGTVLMGKHHFAISNPQKQQVGKVRKALFNVSLPFMKERRTCSIEIAGQEPLQIETYISFKEREYDVSDRNISIKVDQKEKEFQIFNNTSQKPIIHIYKVRSDEGIFNDKYVVGFDNKKYETLAICITIGIDSIRYSEN